jgi:hypothetical protein
MRPLSTTVGPRYQIDVRITEETSKDFSLWLMALIHPEPGKIKDTLYFAKTPVPSTMGVHSVEIQFCHALDPDLRRGLEVVAANVDVSEILAKNRAEEDNEETCDLNSDLTNLAGAISVSREFPFSAASGNVVIRTIRPLGKQDCFGNSFTVDLEIKEPPAKGYSLWLVLRLEPDRSNARPNALHFVKKLLPNRTGRLSVDIRATKQATTEKGTKRTFEIVSANSEASKELKRNYVADKTGDPSFGDGKRVYLPSGSHELAAKGPVVQTC